MTREDSLLSFELRQPQKKTASQEDKLKRRHSHRKTTTREDDLTTQENKLTGRNYFLVITPNYASPSLAYQYETRRIFKLISKHTWILLNKIYSQCFSINSGL